jgi:hypothetical protein
VQLDKPMTKEARPAEEATLAPTRDRRKQFILRHSRDGVTDEHACQLSLPISIGRKLLH